MKIDNQKNIYRIWIRKLLFTILFTASVVAVIFLKFFDQPESPVTKYHVIIAIASVFIIISVIGVLRNPYYFYFDDTNDVLVFRYYPVGIFNSKKNSVQIPKQQFVKFEITKYFLGMEEKLILYQNYRNKVAKYPPISLSAVDKADKEKLKNTLQRHSGKK
ncbi:MAG: hypothetical protein LC655_01990 [Bacteroidales bacterium]|nr:hypothetical protein [Bacteroidales bacterium]